MNQDLPANDDATPSSQPRKSDPIFILFAIICVGASILLFTSPKFGLWLLLLVSAALAYWGLGATPSGRIIRWIMPLAVLLPVAFWTTFAVQERRQAREDEDLIAGLVAKEELILELTPKLNELAQGLKNLKLPDPASAEQFYESVSITDLATPFPPSPAPLENLTVTAASWPVTEDLQSVPARDLDLWRPLLDQVSSFEHAAFNLADGRFLDDAKQRFEGETSWSALARLKSGDWAGLRAQVRLRWRLSPRSAHAGTHSEWRIDHWETLAMEIVSSSNRLFAASLEEALPNPADRRRARKSTHRMEAVRYFQNGATNLPHRFFSPISVLQKPGLSVADVDQDGFDDLYILVPLGRNLLLHNQGNGTFVEAAARFGLDLADYNTSALFADFDNDGDPDVMLGRSLQSCLYLENTGERFEPRDAGIQLPFLAISLAAADYNKDGLLDVYVSTYRPPLPLTPGLAGGNPSEMAKWPDVFLDEETGREYYRRYYAAKRGANPLFENLLNQVGPPNVLLANRGGGRFEIAPESPQIEGWRNSTQAAWTDFDEDGDPDLYVANDWAPDQFYRNDGPDGFLDITKSAGFDRIGFAKGIAWGDYDNDGRLDIYLSNGFSEAGRRLTAGVEGVNPALAAAANGNSLYRQTDDGRFARMSGPEAPARNVANAGWSWGGQFADFDNDGFVDLYVPSGFFTAPEPVASGVDMESHLWRAAVRADETMDRETLRFSESWNKSALTGETDTEDEQPSHGGQSNEGRFIAHSLGERQPNRFFFNRRGRGFADLSAISGVDGTGDGRAFVVWDYDRDGWQDIALVNANEPMLELFHNEMVSLKNESANGQPARGMIALRFVGGNRSPSPSSWSHRDGYGAVVEADLGEMTVKREHRCGEGFGAQNSATMILGMGDRDDIPSLTVRWPSGASASTEQVPAGTLLTVFENPADSPNGRAFVREVYSMRAALPDSASKPAPPHPRFPLAD